MHGLKTDADTFLAHARNYVSLQTELDRVLKPNGVLMDSVDQSAAAFGSFTKSVFCLDDHSSSSRLPTHNCQAPELTITPTMVLVHL